MALKAGNTDFAGSMAEAMQNAFNDEIAIRKPRADEQMKFLFIAVAEGLIRHLAAHPEAFNLIVTSSMGDDVSINARVDSISSTGT
jgi:hypothetical protein